jgi:unsaturated rhamnogalacturonyl hydrolase
MNSRAWTARMGLVWWAVACAPRPSESAAAAVPPGPAPAPSSSVFPSPAAPVPASEIHGSTESAQTVATVQVKNPLPEPRASETLSVPVAELGKLWMDPTKVVVVDREGRHVLSQLVDLDGDETADELVFQTDLGPNQTKVHHLRFGVRPSPKREQFKVYGRFVRERHDDFAWENDRMARRVYGPDLESWPREPLSSSGIDVWVKRTSKLVINDWYLVDDYHQDHGEGADFYSVGKSRGCGGLGVWHQEKLEVSRNFVLSRVLANGPIRLVFELTYAPWKAAGGRVSEKRRVTLDAGHDFEQVQSSFQQEGRRGSLFIAVGIAKHAKSELQVDPKANWMLSWEPIPKGQGSLGCGIVLAPGASAEPKQTETDYLLVTEAPASGKLVYYSGFGWDKSGRLADRAAWSGQVDTQARHLASPVEVTIAPAPGAKPWSVRTCDSVLERHPGVLTDRWRYDTGFVLAACERVGRKTSQQKYLDYVKRTLDGLVAADGTIPTYRLEDHSLDHLQTGNLLLALLERTEDSRDQERYRKAIELLRSQVRTQPRTSQGGFWHRRKYPQQMWLDGAFMALPFLARYAVKFDEPALFAEVGRQFTLLEKNTRDPKTGLLYHGWDESRKERWADPKTGKSPHFWGRAMGWYAMALVDVLEVMPKNRPERAEVQGVLERLAVAISSVQDRDSGVWWQVLDAPKRGQNFREASASAMFVYALSKGVRNGWLDAKKYAPAIARGYRGVLQQFVEVDGKGLLDLTQVCKVAGLGGNPYRDGSYAYYTSCERVANDPKGVGAYILASLERESRHGAQSWLP